MLILQQKGWLDKMVEYSEMKKALIAKAQEQMTCLEKVNAEELGEVIDMIKDLEEATYYCMKNKEHESKNNTTM